MTDFIESVVWSAGSLQSTLDEAQAQVNMLTAQLAAATAKRDMVQGVMANLEKARIAYTGDPAVAAAIDNAGV